MQTPALDALARSTGSATDRRTTLIAIGAAAAGAFLTAPLATEAKKRGKKRRNRNRGRNRCKRQVRPCSAFVIAECGDDQECKDTFVRC